MASASASPSLPFATYRLNNPPELRRVDWSKLFPLHRASEEIVGSSISPDVYGPVNSKHVATLTFNQRPEAIKSLALHGNGDARLPLSHGSRDAGAARARRVIITVDSHFRCFTSLNDCAPESTVEYVSLSASVALNQLVTANLV